MLKDINFEISEGEKVGVVGPSGSGKSTLLFVLTKNIVIDFTNEDHYVKISGKEVSRLNL